MCLGTSNAISATKLSQPHTQVKRSKLWPQRPLTKLTGADVWHKTFALNAGMRPPVTRNWVVSSGRFEMVYTILRREKFSSKFSLSHWDLTPGSRPSSDGAVEEDPYVLFIRSNGAFRFVLLHCRSLRCLAGVGHRGVLLSVLRVCSLTGTRYSFAFPHGPISLWYTGETRRTISPEDWMLSRNSWVPAVK